RFLQERGFTYHSLSDVLREELKHRRLALTRDNLTVVGNELREKLGPSALAERILQTLDDSRNYVVDSFRNPGEVSAFRRRRDFQLWAVQASPKMRFTRIRDRARE